MEDLKQQNTELKQKNKELEIRLKLQRSQVAQGMNMSQLGGAEGLEDDQSFISGFDKSMLHNLSEFKFTPGEQLPIDEDVQDQLRKMRQELELSKRATQRLKEENESLQTETDDYKQQCKDLFIKCNAEIDKNRRLAESNDADVKQEVIMYKEIIQKNKEESKKKQRGLKQDFERI